MLLGNLLFKLRELLDNNPAKRDRFILVSFIFVLILILASFLIIPLFFRSEEEYIVLHYNIYFGISSLGPWYWLFVNPLLSLVVAIINFILAVKFYLRNKIVSYLLVGFSVSCSLVLLFALGLIIYINY
jgi:hypothetical protein